MSAAVLSYIGALTAIIAFGSYMAPIKKWPTFSSYATVGALSWGILTLSLIIAAVTGTWSFSAVGFGCGLFWVVGGALCFSAVKNEADLSGTSVRSMGMCILSSFISGLIVFKEPVVIPVAIVAVIVLCAGLCLLSPNFHGLWKKWRSIAAGFVFGVHLVPKQIAGLSDLEFALSYALGIFLAANILMLCMRKSEGITAKPITPWIASFFAGALWLLGTHGSFWAIAEDGDLGFAVGYPLTQMNLLVNIGIGVFVFGEHPGTKARLKLLAAALIILAGAVLLTLSKLWVN